MSYICYGSSANCCFFSDRCDSLTLWSAWHSAVIFMGWQSYVLQQGLGREGTSSSSKRHIKVLISAYEQTSEGGKAETLQAAGRSGSIIITLSQKSDFSLKSVRESQFPTIILPSASRVVLTRSVIIPEHCVILQTLTQTSAYPNLW